MNISVATFTKKEGVQQVLYHFRPDNTLQRDVTKDFYVPHSVEGILLRPVVVIKISKAGKAILPQFAGRYYDTFCYGLLLDCVDPAFEGNDAAMAAVATSADNTSIIPLGMWNKAAYNGEMLQFSLEVAGERKAYHLPEEKITDALVSVSAKCSLKMGDLLCIDLHDFSTGIIGARLGDNIKGITGPEDDQTVIFDFNIC